MRRKSWFSSGLIALLLLSVTVCLFVFATGQLSARVGAEQLSVVENAVRRNAMQCYAVEGRYPPDLSYLEERYGLMIDHDRFVVHYYSQGANLLPEISVFPLH